MTLIQIKVPLDYTPEDKIAIGKRIWRYMKAGYIVQLRLWNSKTKSYV